jgi:hypothetical protein
MIPLAIQLMLRRLYLTANGLPCVSANKPTQTHDRFHTDKKHLEKVLSIYTPILTLLFKPRRLGHFHILVVYNKRLAKL